MRKLTEPEAHRARTEILEGRYPEGMKARCAWCRRVAPANEGEFVTVEIPGTGHTKLFKCLSCLDDKRNTAA